MQAIEFNIGNLKFTVVCSSCHHNCNGGDFRLLFCRGQHWIVLNCVLHVLPVCFSSFNQSKLKFVVLSLPFLLLMPKLLNDCHTTASYSKSWQISTYVRFGPVLCNSRPTEASVLCNLILLYHKEVPLFGFEVDSNSDNSDECYR